MSKKVLFIDRDGTLVLEPPTDYQLDSFEKLQFYPKTLSYLSRIATEMNYELVMVSNQDGLGTDSFPESDFFPVHNLIIETLENEGIHFAKQHIDRTFEKDNATTRKPHTGMLQEYFSDTYDLENSFVIGDRFSDIELAHNLGAKGIFMEGSPSLDSTLEQWQKSTPKVAKSLATIANDWEKVYYFLKKNQRTVSVERNTKETQIQIHLALDGSGESEIHTGIGFFDHMLEQISKHALVDLKIQVQGDLEIDEHHTWKILPWL